MALDECMWPWTGNHPAVVFIPRKPNPPGFKVHCLCVQSTRTERPYCFHFIPDLHELGESLTPTSILDSMKNIILEYMPHSMLTMDSWYTMFGWVEANRDCSAVGSLKANQLPYMDLFTHNLKQKEFRTFVNSNNNVVLTVFADENIVRTMSNGFMIGPPLRVEATGEGLRGIPFLPPRLSANALRNLQEWNHQDLVALARAIGESTGNSYVVLFMVIKN